MNEIFNLNLNFKAKYIDIKDIDKKDRWEIYKKNYYIYYMNTLLITFFLFLYIKFESV